MLRRDGLTGRRNSRLRLCFRQRQQRRRLLHRRLRFGDRRRRLHGLCLGLWQRWRRRFLGLRFGSLSFRGGRPCCFGRRCRREHHGDARLRWRRQHNTPFEEANERQQRQTMRKQRRAERTALSPAGTARRRRRGTFECVARVSALPRPAYLRAGLAGSPGYSVGACCNGGATRSRGVGNGGTQGRSPRKARSVRMRARHPSSHIAVAPFFHTVKRSTSAGQGRGHSPRAGSAETITDDSRHLSGCDAPRTRSAAFACASGRRRQASLRQATAPFAAAPSTGIGRGIPARGIA